MLGQIYGQKPPIYTQLLTRCLPTPPLTPDFLKSALTPDFLRTSKLATLSPPAKIETFSWRSWAFCVEKFMEKFHIFSGLHIWLHQITSPLTPRIGPFHGELCRYFTCLPEVYRLAGLAKPSPDIIIFFMLNREARVARNCISYD